MIRALAFLLALAPGLAWGQSISPNVSTTLPTGGTTYRSNADLAGDFVRATSFGANFDGVVVNSGATMTVGSAVLNWSGGSFVPADVGKLISVDGAGVNGRPLNTTIAGYTSATSVTLGTTALSSVPDSSLSWLSGYQSGPTVSAAGTGYVPGDKITLTGGTATYQGVMLVVGTKVITATIAAGGSGGTTGACTITGTTGNSNGTTTLFQATGTVAGGALTGALVVTVAGEYRDNPTAIAAEPVTGCGLTGATVTLTMGVLDILVQQPGAYSVRPSDPISQGSTTGSGTGVQFTGDWFTSGSFTYGTDNGTAVQAAITYCQGNVVLNAGGCSVLLPIGTGLTSTTLTVNKSNVSLYSLSRSVGFQQRNIVAAANESFPTRMLYVGADNPGYMLTQVPLVGDGHRLAGVDVVGIMFDCSAVQGCSGISIRSTAFSTYNAAVNEPYPRAYTITGGAVGAGTRVVTVTDATGVDVGQQVWTPNALSGTYVESVSGNTITLSSKVYGTGLGNGKTIYIGGEAWRIDVLGTINVNDVQYNNFYLYGRTLNSPAGCVQINGSAIPGAVEFGNTSLNFFRDIGCDTGAGDQVDANDSDHNYWYSFSGVTVPNSFGVGAAFVANGTLNANNGGSRYNWFFLTPGRTAVIMRGTSAGGFTTATFGNTLQWVISSGVPRIIVDTAGGASACVSEDIAPAVGCIGGPGVLANYPDSTAVGGNSRGANAVDLQSTRTAAAMVASGAAATIGGGINNTASGDDSFAVGSGVVASGSPGSVAVGVGTTASNPEAFAGGNGATASGTQSFSYGQNTIASGNTSQAWGISSTADLYAETCLSGGVVASGKKSQECKQVLRAVSGTNTTPVRLTADAGAASGINCANLSIAGQINNMRVQLSAVDSTTTTNLYTWRQPQTLLAMPSNAASTVLVAGGSPTAVTSGTTTGIAIVETADTTNACYNLSFTPPTGNTHVWHVSATVTWTRTD